MKYYKIDTKRFYENDMIATNAQGKEIENADDYFWRMNKGEIIDDAPSIFDYFVLESFDLEKYWEWNLFDVFRFIGEGSQIPGWLISKKLKKILENFNIAEPHFYYASKLLFKGEKLDYYIFQFSGINIVEDIRGKIDFEKCIFLNSNNNKDILVKSKDEFVIEKKRIRLESRQNGKNSKIEIKKLVLKDDLDFFPMYNFLDDNIASERLRQAIEENEITGFEFSELDYEVIVGK